MMNNMKALIIEDEQFAADRLEELLLEIIPEVKIQAKIGSIKESIQWLRNNKTDIIFLDIQLSDGISFSIFDQINIKTPVIFTTAYDQYAIKAFDLNSIAYLLKPIRKKDLEESLDKYQSLKSAFTIDFENLLAGLQGQTNYKKRFLIQLGEKLIKINTKDIAYFYAFEKNVFSKTFQNKTYPMDFSIEKLEQLIDPSQFYRINRKFLINMDAISKMVAWSRSRVKIELEPKPDPNLDTIVSIERTADFKAWLNR